jgi:glycosyltransferase involved in cell wall biosynthesis
MQSYEEIVPRASQESCREVPPVPRSALAALRGHDVVIVSPQYWCDYWVSKHWIAYELSRELRTVFIEPPVWVGGMVKAPCAHRADFGRLARPLRKLRHNLYALTPRLLPAAAERWLGRTNERTVKLLRRLGIRRPIILNFSTNVDLVRQIEGAVTAYYCVDPPFLETGHEDDEAQMCEVSDVVYAVSETYRRHLNALCSNKTVHVIPHGYAFEHARRVYADPAAACPIDLRTLPRPILGFVGSVHDANLDIELVERLARARPDHSIVLIGPYRGNPLGADLSIEGLRRLRRLPNVHLLGPRNFLELPRYIKYFDVCLVLVNVKDPHATAMTNRRTHFKWLAYLAMGKPIVAPHVKETEDIGSLIYLAADDDGYVAAVDRALAESDGFGASRVSYASQFSFGKTLEAIAGPIAQLLNGASARPSDAPASSLWGGRDSKP